MPILETIQTLLTSRYTRSLKITSSKYIFFLELLACLAQHPCAFTSRCRRDKEERGALEPPPAEDFLRFPFVQALQTSSKTNKRSSPADIKQNKAREYTTAKFKTLATTYRLEMMPILETIQTLLTSRYNQSLKITSSKQNIFLELLACLAQHPSAFTSRCGTDTAGRGALEPPPEDGARTKLFDRQFQFREFRILRPARKKLQTESPKKRLIIYI